MSRRSRRTTLAATASLTLALLLGACGYSGMNELPLPGSPDVGARPITVTAEFDDVVSLARNATVKYRDVTVGRVASIGRSGWRARVTLTLRRDLDLPADVTARIAQTSLLGEKYVMLEADDPRPGSSPDTLADGDLIPIARTSRGREIEEVLGAVSLLLNGGGLAQLKTISTELDTALGDTASTRRFLDQLDRFVGTLDQQRSRIVSTFANLDRLAGQVAADRVVVRNALRELTPAIRSLAGQRRQLVAMLAQVDGFAVTASNVVRQTGADLRADLDALAPVLTQLAAAGDDVPKALETALSFPFPDEVLDAVKGDYVNLDVLVDISPLLLAGNVLGDDGSLTALLDPRPRRPRSAETDRPAAPASPSTPRPSSTSGVETLLELLGIGRTR